MDILMISHLSGQLSMEDNDRFKYIANLLIQAGHHVELVMSDFEHHKKAYRDFADCDQFPFKITLLHEPKYNSNVSLKRIISHSAFARQVSIFLKTRKRPDVVYCSVPPLKTAVVVAKYAKENQVRLVIDIQDLWPEAFKLVLKIPLVSNILLYPMRLQADYAYKAADVIIAVSQTYADRALRVNKKCKQGISVFLGTDLFSFDRYANCQSTGKPDNEIWIAYVGNVGYSYDLNCVIDAIQVLASEGINNIKFVVIGDGPLKDKYEAYARNKKISSDFTGRKKYADMVALLSLCDLAVNPIMKGGAQSIVNKVGDYAAGGLPVINSQENPEYRSLVNQLNIGLNCSNGDSADMARKMKILCNDKELRQEMGKNNRKLAEEKFDRSVSYKQIVDILTFQNQNGNN